MRCSKAQEFLSLKIDGMLPPAATADLREHLDQCGDCLQYLEDLQMGRRLLEATEPALPDNFDWKLQLKLNQTLKETAGESAYPWIEESPDRRSWLRNFSTAAAMGMAAVLAFALFLGPDQQGASPVAAGAGAPVQALSSDRLPLQSPFAPVRTYGRQVRGGSPFQQRVSGGAVLDRGWSGSNYEDLQLIRRLRAENQSLTARLAQSQLQLQLMRAQLDSTRDDALDLPVSEP
jgi:hypothetical protein